MNRVYNLIKKASIYGWITYPTLFRAKPGQVDGALSMGIEMAKSMGAEIDYEYDEEGSFIKFKDHKSLTYLIKWLLDYAMDPDSQDTDPEGVADSLAIANELKNTN